ncbi:MAG: DUF4956 domain-containing protein [Bacteroidales bacterium]|nr:DUF4956 domain-containing protein [Bacteroidales bacterium]
MFDNLFNLNNPNFLGIMIRFVINLIVLFCIIKLVYFRYCRKEMFFFAFFLMGIMIFFIGSVLNAVFLEIGMAVGLFAIFTILRLRTTNVSVKDMAYMFTVIGISVINSLKLVGFPLLGIIIINIIVVVSAYILEEFLVRNSSDSHSIVYRNLELLRSNKKQRLLKDISELTGKDVIKFKVRRVDYRSEIALLDIFYKD